jgi:hypothetical protein
MLVVFLVHWFWYAGTMVDPTTICRFPPLVVSTDPPPD